MVIDYRIIPPNHMNNHESRIIWDAFEKYLFYKNFSSHEVLWCRDDIKEKILKTIDSLKNLPADNILDTKSSHLNFTQKKLLLHINKLDELFSYIHTENFEESLDLFSKKFIEFANSQTIANIFVWEDWYLDENKFSDFIYFLYDNFWRDEKIITHFIEQGISDIFYISIEQKILIWEKIKELQLL